MKAFFYPRLALDGMKKNRRLYLPYLLTCIGMIMMFYIILFLYYSPAVNAIRGASTVTVFMMLGSWVMALFSLLFLFYTNSFLIRRRKKELALYNILGMGKKNIAKILWWETVFQAVLSLVGGLFFGIAFSKLAELGLLRLLKAETFFSLTLSAKSVLRTLWVYALIFLLQFLSSLKQIAFSKPCDLAKSENVGEKPPKANWLLGLGGFVILGIAYYLAVSIQNPIDAVFYFFIAVLMVILATYLLFIAGSVLLCKVLQKNKKYYYQPRHFVSVSSMAYRMKRNGAGLASVCILATMVLVILSSTSCLFFGEEKLLDRQFPREVVTEYTFCDRDSFTRDNCEKLTAWVLSCTEREENISSVRYFYTAGLWKDTVLTDPSAAVDYDKLYCFFFAEAKDYGLALQDGEAVLICNRSNKKDTLSFAGGPSYKILSCKKGDFGVLTRQMTGMATNVLVLVNDLDREIDAFAANDSLWNSTVFTLQVAFDTPLSFEEKDILCGMVMSNETDARWETCRTAFKENDRQDFLNSYGGLFYLGILLSMVFLLATVLILYYKQISEGYEDQGRFEVMQKVGMTERNIRQSINAQLLLVFFLPLLMAGLHMAFAFPMVQKLLLLFGLYQTDLFIFTTLISILIFGILYFWVYRITSHAYLRIVKKQ